jgi:uncharacterized protein (TIGR03663 family)
MYRSGYGIVTVLRGGPVVTGMSGPADDRESATVAGGIAVLRRRWRSVGVVRAVVAVALLALAARFVLLGARTAHWDEARVAYWILQTVETGDFAYRRIIHGPFVQHVNHVLLGLLGASDFVMRLPVALVGGLLPLSALLFREHLDDDETVVLALFLGANAVLIYYSRFMRSDVLVATFMFVGLGLLVRFYDTRRWRYLYGLGALVALGFGAKENAAVYVLTWVGATALLADQALLAPPHHESGYARLRATWLGRVGAWLRAIPGRVRDRVAGRSSSDLGAIPGRVGSHLRRTSDPSTTAGRVARWLVHPLGALVVFLVVIVFLYAPRGAGEAGLYYPPAEAGAVGLYEALARPTALPGLVVDTLADTTDQYVEWFTQTGDPGCHKEDVLAGWICYLGRYLAVMRDTALVLTVFAVLGFASERWFRGRTRNLVMFAGYAGFVSVLGYPLGTDVFGAWIVVHAVVPLAIPAAVGVTRIYRWGLESVAEDDEVGAALAAVVLLLLVAQVAMVNAGAVYTNDTAGSNTLVQYAQPADDLDPLIDAVERSADEGTQGPGVVLYYGANGSDRVDTEALVSQVQRRQEGDLLTRPACAKWFNTLPLPWYFAKSGANVTCDDNPGELVTRADTAAPGVIVTMGSDGTVPTERLRGLGYANRTFGLRTDGYHAEVFVHERIGGI